MARLISDSNLVLLNDGSPTRVDDNTGNFSVLDLSLVSPSIAASCQWLPIDDSLGSDHFPIVIKFKSDTIKEPSAPKFNVKKADWVSFTKGVNIEIVGETIDDKVNNIQDNILKAAMATIPKTSVDSAKHRVPWWTPDCRRVLCERNRAYRLFKNRISDENFRKYKLARARARRTIRQAKRDSWRCFVSSINSETSISQVWSTVRKLNKKKISNKITNITFNNINYDEPRDIANALARQFSFASSSENYHPAFLPIKEASELQHIDFATGDELDYNSDLTMQELVQALGACSGTSPGPDEIRYEMIKHLDHDSMVKMLQVFNEIWRGHTFPNSWHFAHVIPIPKGGGDPRSTSSYRPIALTSCLCKVMERIVNRRLLHFLNSRNLLVDEQCGFRKGRQTLDQLVNLEVQIQEAFAKKQFLIAVFLDIEKAYDMTWRHGLLRKLYAMGLRGNLPFFVKNFISDRTFSVKLFSDTVTFSDIFVQANGVPQGSVLSLTLFLCMINDILPAPPRNLKYSLYADDCAIWHSSCNAEFSATRIQLALDLIHNWVLQWGFKFSVRKSVGVIFTHRKKPDVRLTMGVNPLPIQNSTKFLGLYFDSRLTWRVHVSQLKIKCLKALNLLKCISGTQWGADRKSLLMLYKSLIRSRVDYGSIVYGSASESVLKGLDVVQNACLRVCLGALRCTRIERLEVESQVPPLRLRRDQLLLVYCAKKSRVPSHLPGNALLRQQHPGGHGARPLAEGPSRPSGNPCAPGGTGVRPMGTRPQVQVPGEPSHPPGNALVRHLQPGGHGDRPPEGPSYPPGRRTAPEGTGVRSLRARLHDLVECVGIELSTIDSLVLVNIAPWVTPSGGGGHDRPPPPQTNEPRNDGRYETRTPLDIDVKNASFVMLHATGSAPLAGLNPFIVQKVIDGWAGVVESVKKLASGDLLVKTFNSKQVATLLKLRQIHNYEVEAKIPQAMNSCRGVITCRDLMMMEETEIIEEMKNQDIIDARFITRLEDGIRKKTATLILTFGKVSLPETVKIGYEIVKVRPFILNPLRCLNCQIYGHGNRTCKASSPVCGRCATPGHAEEKCTSVELSCFHCKGTHSTSSRDCPKWKLEKEVCSVKAVRGISYHDARKAVMGSQATPSPNISYASAVISRPVMCTISTQTESEPSEQAEQSTSTPTIITPSKTITKSTNSYSQALQSEKQKKKSDKYDKINYTTLKPNKSLPCTHPTPTSSGERRDSSSSVESGRLTIDEEAMDVSGRKNRERSPGSYSPRGGRHKKTKRSGRPRNS
ncbi:hypothetical protein Pcinc_024981 [Petrolisthes cinctipes]|uniref:Reverse transcriptase domain-containing protein n=1 Tax=Petrolisthes cinctipes TaxID=88211 RepID=A0AAE1KDP6_PETCI|nr:hypothetical protein Pcinc_024981 [Petrolisthes cinctipes]